MAKANVDPTELRRFARDLSRFNTDLETLMNSLHARLRGLEKTWIDQEQKKFTPTGVIFENKVCSQEFIKQLSLLPSRQELLTQVVVRVKSPISGFVMTLGQVVRGLVQVLSEVKKKREAQPSTA